MAALEPLTLYEAAFTEIGRHYWLECLQDGVCNVKTISTFGYKQYTIYTIGYEAPWALQISFTGDAQACTFYLKSTNYNKTWRLWRSQPSIEESRAAPWS